MTDGRETEAQRREMALSGQGKVVEGSGEMISRRLIKQMVSVRLEPALIAELREVARTRGTTVSELLRECAAHLAEESRRSSVSVSLDVWRPPSPPSFDVSATYWDAGTRRTREAV